MIWVDELPPAPENQYRRRARFLEELKTQPGKWAQYHPGVAHAQTAASRWKANYPGVEAASRPREEGGYDIYVRWVG